MVGIHRVFREAVTSGPKLVSPVSAGDTDRAEFVGTYYDNVLRLLHVHHEGEDELMTPRLAERATADEAAAVERIAAQHLAVMGDLVAAEQSLAEWRAAPDARTGAALSDALATLNVSLGAHLAEEERVVLPIAARYLNVAEWGALPAHGLQHFTGDKLWLILGLIQEQMTPEQAAEMNAHMPPPLADFWTNVGTRMFTDFVASLRA